MGTGERFTSVSRRLHTPTASELRDQDFVDSGIAMHLAHNAAWLQHERVRPLAMSLGPGLLTNNTRGYTHSSGTPLIDRPDPGTYTGVNVISWSATTSVRFGPVFLLSDREVTDEPTRPRKIRVNVDCTGAALTLLVAVTPPNAFPGPGQFVFGSTSVTTGRGIATIDVEPDPVLVAQQIPCRRPDTDGEQTVVLAGEVWVGWYSTSGTNAVYAITVQEIR